MEQQLVQPQQQQVHLQILQATLTTAAQPNITSVGTLGSVDIDGGAIDGTTIGATTAAAGTFTNIAGTLTTAAQPNITSVGTLGSVDIDGGAIDGTTIGATTAAAGTFTNIAGTLTTAAQPNITSIGTLGSVDIDGGSIDGTIIGANTPAAATFTQINLNNGTGISTITKDTNKITLDPHPAGGDISGTVVIKGDLIVDGTTTTINSTNVDISDSILTLNSNLASNVAASLDAGFIVNRGSNSDVSFLWDETNNRWTIGSETFVAGTVIADVTGNVSGSSGSCTGNAETVTNGVYTTSSVTVLNDVTSAGSGAIITSAERTKLSGIEIGADVTDATNVAAAGAVMDSGDQTIAGVKTFSSTIVGSINGNAASVTNGVYTTSSVTVLNDVTSAGSGAIITSDERTKLSGIETAADVTDATNVEAAGAVMKTGDQTIAGEKTFSTTIVGSINGNAASVTNGVYTTSSVTVLNDVTSAGSGAIITSDERTKLSGIETGADVTDATNVEAAGAVMNTGDETIAGEKTFSTTIIGSINGNAATATTAATVTTAAQPNITSVGTLTGLTSSGFIEAESFIGDISLVKYNIIVSSSKYIINTLETPTLVFEIGKTYRFKQDDNTNNNHPIKFYNDAAKTSQYSTNVTTNGTPGNTGSYSQIFITSQTPNELYYQCEAHSNMGGKILILNNSLENAVMNSGDETIGGVKTFSSTIVGNINGNAASVTNGVYTTSSVTVLNDVTSAGSGAIITDAERTKLSGIETAADVTDATNVAAAGAVMNSGDETIAGEKTFSTTIVGSINGNAASVTNGVYTTSSVTALNDVTSVGSGAIITNAERTKLSGIETAADVTDATNVAAAGAVMNTGDETIGGEKTFSSTIVGSINGSAATVTNPAQPNITSVGILSSVNIDGGAIDGTIIGANSAAAATFTQINLYNASGNSTITKETNKITIDPQPAEGDISGTVVIKGDLIVDGTTTKINSTNVDISDRILTLNSNLTGTPSLNAGLEIERGSSTNKTFLWDETNDRWTIGSDTFVAGTVIASITGNVSGSSGSCTGNAATVTNGVYTTSSVTALSDVTSVGSGAIITSAERTKLNNIEASADVTDATNVA